MSADPAEDAEAVGEENLSDRGGGARSSRGTRPLTPRQRRAGLARLEDPLASERRVMLRAGYSDGTSRNPGNNLPAPTHELADRLAQERGVPTLRQIEEAGARRALKVVTDETSSDQTASMVFLAVARHRREFDDGEDPHAITPTDKLFALASQYQAARIGVRLCALYGPQRALERLLAAAEARLHAPLDEVLRADRAARRSTHEGTSLPVRQLHARER